MQTTLIPVLGDQLSPTLSSLCYAPADAVILIAEVMGEARYVRHHPKKIALVLSAMRHFAEELREAGWTVDYVCLDDPDNTGTLTGEVGRALDRLGASAVQVTEPGEWRLMHEMRGWQDLFNCPVTLLEDDRFLASHADFDSWAEGRKQLRMEYFYREMRARTGLLMEGNQPAGGKWNYDSENRKPASDDLFMPRPPRFEPDAITRDVLNLVAVQFDDHPGRLEPFWFAVTRANAEAALDHFMDHALPDFGTFQDAMLTGAPFLYHSVLSGYLNLGLLEPLALCRRAEAAWARGHAPLNAVEGFIRQIIGWREYVRGIYWREGPDYVHRNALEANRPLPWFYWTGETDMACLAAAIGQTLDEAYAHHIQRLMVTGNFALLAGIDPHAVHEWYLAVYFDAFEWVEAPNTIGMALYADGGLLASKPYAASGNYINRMSDYCTGCRYNVNERTGPDACPFNPLYWHFLDRNRGRLGKNARLRQIYATWDRMEPERQRAVLQSARAFLKKLDAGV